MCECCKLGPRLPGSCWQKGITRNHLPSALQREQAGELAALPDNKGGRKGFLLGSHMAVIAAMWKSTHSDMLRTVTHQLH